MTSKVGLMLAFAACACSRTPSENKAQLESAAIARGVGSLEGAVDVKEYALPSGSLPHDPAVAPDGALWVTEEKANQIGRLDPTRQTWRQYPMKTADSGPHGLVVDDAGNVWFTASHKGYIGELVPSTGEVIEHALPDPKANDPHTPILGANGVLWFTVEDGNDVGRLDRATGKIDLVRMPTHDAKPYGVVLGADGAPYVCELGSNRIARVDPETLAIRELVLPEGARPRRIALARDGTLFYTDYARGRLGHLDPKSGHVDEWISPGGGTSKPYGIAITPDGYVWYSESGVDPNTLVRFDPTKRAFALEAIPSGGGVVRNMAATSNGRVFLAESGKDKVAIVIPRRLPF